ncbi:MAG: hypothetical protein CMJ89_15950 [Planctomycetes bacterium]|jgi:hemerythrin-like domain-containing protein|nr:hypothetical protein [Planctomycetota bacterium]
MKAIEILSQEHRVILRVLTCLQRLLGAGKTAGHVDDASARKAIDFFRTFADACHHGKEEGCLFPKLVECGLPGDSGPVPVMLSEHDTGRETLCAMLEALEGAAAGDPNDLTAFIHWGGTYVELLRNHIAKEDNILFPLAARLLSDEDQREVLQGYEAAEKAHGRGTHERMLALADELCERYAVQSGDVNEFVSAAHGSCDGHGCGD